MTLITLSYLPSAIALIIAVLVLWANPRRPANQAAAVYFLWVVLWLGIRGISVRAEIDHQGWFRMTVFIGAWGPAVLWILKEALIAGNWREVRMRSGWFFVAVGLVSILPWTNWFIPPHSSREVRVHGWGYPVYLLSQTVLFGLLAKDAIVRMRHVNGATRMELRSVVLSGTFWPALIFLRMLFDRALPAIVSQHSTNILVLLGMVPMAYACFARRIFDVQYIARLSARVLVIAAGAGAGCFAAQRLLGPYLPAPVGYWAMGGSAIAVGVWLRRRVDGWLFYFPATNAARSALHVAARQARSEPELAREFQNVIGGWAKAERVWLGLLSERGDVHLGDWSLGAADAALVTLRQIGWATPERLERERQSAGRARLLANMREQKLGAMVLGHQADDRVVLAVGVSATRRPVTFVEIERLEEFALIAESALERLRLTAQSVQSEKLATVGMLGASLAHEIRNPLYAIRAFVELLPGNYDRMEFRDHFAKMVGGEIVRIDHLLSQLMNVAAPRATVPAVVALHEVAGSACELVLPKARAGGIAVQTYWGAEDDAVLADAGALKQVLLNLALNAMQAQENGPEPRWIRIETRDLDAGLELTVSDGGAGVPPDLRPRLFQPFQSAKANGLGLGLSVSREVLGRFGATIELAETAPGQGAVFRLVFPRPAVLSAVELDGKMAATRKAAGATAARSEGAK